MLGQWWHQETKLPLPLGIDVIRRDLGSAIATSFSSLFRKSIEYALAHREEALPYALQFGRGIRKDLGDRFVGMYVNEDTVDLGTRGQQALALLFEKSYEKGLIPQRVKLEFV